MDYDVPFEVLEQNTVSLLNRFNANARRYKMLSYDELRQQIGSLTEFYTKQKNKQNVLHLSNAERPLHIELITSLLDIKVPKDEHYQILLGAIIYRLKRTQEKRQKTFFSQSRKGVLEKLLEDKFNFTLTNMLDPETSSRCCESYCNYLTYSSVTCDSPYSGYIAKRPEFLTDVRELTEKEVKNAQALRQKIDKIVFIQSVLKSLKVFTPAVETALYTLSKKVFARFHDSAVIPSTLEEIDKLDATSSVKAAISEFLPKTLSKESIKSNDNNEKLEKKVKNTKSDYIYAYLMQQFSTFKTFVLLGAYYLVFKTSTKEEEILAKTLFEAMLAKPLNKKNRLAALNLFYCYLNTEGHNINCSIWAKDTDEKGEHGLLNLLDGTIDIENNEEESVDESQYEQALKV